MISRSRAFEADPRRKKSCRKKYLIAEGGSLPYRTVLPPSAVGWGPAPPHPSARSAPDPRPRARRASPPQPRAAPAGAGTLSHTVYAASGVRPRRPGWPAAAMTQQAARQATQQVTREEIAPLSRQVALGGSWRPPDILIRAAQWHVRRRIRRHVRRHVRTGPLHGCAARQAASGRAATYLRRHGADAGGQARHSGRRRRRASKERRRAAPGGAGRGRACRQETLEWSLEKPLDQGLEWPLEKCLKVA